jgi:DNA-binding GntR family transcriptional regulator
VAAPMPRTRADAVAQELRRMIQSGELAAGTRLRQDELAERFGVSTTPVREALTALARERLIRQDAHRGAIVFPSTIDDIRENFEIRLALEPLATRLAAPNCSDDDLAVLEDLAARLRDIVEDPTTPAQPGRYEQLDRALHARIFVAAGRPRLAEMIDSLRDASVAYAHLHTVAADQPELLAALQAQHEQLVTALRRRDAQAGARIAADHVWLTGTRHGFEPGGEL